MNVRMMSARLHADWPAPRGVHAFITLRYGAGASMPPFDHFNLGNFRGPEGDDPAIVMRNRAELVERFALPSPPHWLRQVHGTDVVRFDAPCPHPGPLPQAGEGADQFHRERLAFPPAGEGRGEDEPEADASVTSVAGVVLAILTADCLPVVFAAKDGSEVAIAHAGWPGLSSGMLENAVAAMRTPATGAMAWIGPCAGPMRYEVGRDVFDAFVSRDAAAVAAFAPVRAGHWLADLPALARMRLAGAGMAVADIHGGDLCTISDAQRFFSHRRDGRSGRMATIAWIAP